MTAIVTPDNTFGIQTFDFGNTFTDIVSISWANNPAYHQFDNLVEPPAVQPTPEPGTVVLLVAGMGALLALRKRMRTR